MDLKSRNTYLGTAMFVEHLCRLQPSVVDMANIAARDDGCEIPYDVELSEQDRREIAKVAADTVLLGIPEAEFGLLMLVHLVNCGFQTGFLTAHDAFSLVNELTGREDYDFADYTEENWRNAIYPIMGFRIERIVVQLQELRDKANRAVLRSNDEVQRKLAVDRAHWEQIYQRQIEYMASAGKPTMDDHMASYLTLADVAWQYQIEIALCRSLHIVRQ